MGAPGAWLGPGLEPPRAVLSTGGSSLHPLCAWGRGAVPAAEPVQDPTLTRGPAVRGGRRVGGRGEPWVGAMLEAPPEAQPSRVTSGHRCGTGHKGTSCELVRGTSASPWGFSFQPRSSTAAAPVPTPAMARGHGMARARHGHGARYGHGVWGRQMASRPGMPVPSTHPGAPGPPQVPVTGPEPPQAPSRAPLHTSIPTITVSPGSLLYPGQGGVPGSAGFRDCQNTPVPFGGGPKA